MAQRILVFLLSAAFTGAVPLAMNGQDKEKQAPAIKGGIEGKVKKVDAEISSNRLGRPFGLALSSSPDRAHYSPGVDALAWPFEEVILKPVLATSCT